MKKRKYGSFAVFLALLLVVSTISVQAAAVTRNGIPAAVATDSIEGWPTGPVTTSEAAVMIDAVTGAVLYDKGKDEIRYPASITKLMTLLVAAENSTLDEQVTFTETGVRDVTWDSGNIGMQLGEVITMKDCLLAAIIYSANEVCAQIAEHVGGTEADFIEMMNQRAREIGCTSTNFANASGLPDENLYTTAYDMAKIVQEGLKNPIFRGAIKTRAYTIPATNMSAERFMNTHLPHLAPESPFYYEGCIGGKTGYTQAAGNTLVVVAQRDGRILIVVSLRCAELSQNSTDAINLFDYGFDNFENKLVDGGIVTVPKGTDVSALQVTETEQSEGMVREYSFNGQYAGTATVVAPIAAPVPTEVPVQNGEQTAEGEMQADENIAGLPEIEEKQEGLSSTAKFLLVVMAVMFVVLLILITALIVKSKKQKKR